MPTFGHAEVVRCSLTSILSNLIIHVLVILLDFILGPSPWGVLSPPLFFFSQQLVRFIDGRCHTSMNGETLFFAPFLLWLGRRARGRRLCSSSAQRSGVLGTGADVGITGLGRHCALLGLCWPAPAASSQHKPNSCPHSYEHQYCPVHGEGGWGFSRGVLSLFSQGVLAPNMATEGTACSNAAELHAPSSCYI